MQLGLKISACLAQVPNSTFEEWQTIDSIENPTHWETNNYYVGYTPVAKTTDAIEGDYSMKVSSTAKDILGTATGYGCAHVKLVLPLEYKYLTASVKIDTVDTEGEVSIRVKQWQAGSGLYEKIGTWKATAATKGVVQVILPIEQEGLDTVLIEVWAKNHYDPFAGTIGYTEMIIDNLQLTTSVLVDENMQKDISWAVFPNPTGDIVHIRLKQAIVRPFSYRIFDTYGRILQEDNFPSVTDAIVDLNGCLPSIYILELRIEGEIVGVSKIVKKSR